MSLFGFVPAGAWPFVATFFALSGGYTGYRTYGYGRLKLAIDATPTTPIGQISQSGYYEVKGKIESSRPLTNPATDRPCVYFEETVFQTYVEFRIVMERNHHQTGPSSNPRTKRANTEELIRTATEECPFFINDGTGRLGVVLAGAEIEAEHESSIAPDTGAKREKYSSINIGSQTHERRKAGVRTDVDVLPIGAEVYAIGAVDVRVGTATMYDSQQETRAFRISVRPEEEQSSELTLQVAGWGVSTLLLEGMAAAALLLP